MCAGAKSNAGLISIDADNPDYPLRQVRRRLVARNNSEVRLLEWHELQLTWQGAICNVGSLRYRHPRNTAHASAFTAKGIVSAGLEEGRGISFRRSA